MDTMERVLVSFRVLRKKALQQIILGLQNGLDVTPKDNGDA